MSKLPIRLPIPFLFGWSRRKKFTCNADADLRDRILFITIYNTSGTDTATEVYLDGNVRSDWGDIRITKRDGLTLVDFGFVRRTATAVQCAFKVNLIDGDTDFYLYYDGPAADLYKIGNVTDIHYDPDGASGGASEQDRVNSLTWITNFKTRMSTYTPDLVVACGDMTGAQDSSEATQLSWMESVLDQLTGVTGTLKRGVAMGNHDFEYITSANVRALVDDYEAWMESGVFYGEFHETDDFVFVSLDSNYKTSDDTHHSISHTGNGYIGKTQLDWIDDYLTAATKEVIIFIHHPCGEFDTEQFTLTKDLYHADDRAALRTILERSQKVVAVFHGHMHFTRTDIIQGIPYIVITNLSNDGAFGEVPTSGLSGKWGLIDIDKSSRVIRVRHEALISGTPTIIYDQYIPMAKTVFNTDKGDNLEEVFKLGKAAGYGRYSFLRDPCQLNVINDDYQYKFPSNFQTPDDFAEVNGIRINGRTDDPNFGRSSFIFENMGEKFICRFLVVMKDQATKHFKMGGPNASASPGIYITFNEDGTIYASDAVGTQESIQPYSLDTEYFFELFVDPVNGGYSGKINNVSNIGIPTAFGFFTGPCKQFRELEIVSETGDCWIQGFCILPWHSPRPTVEGFDPEETE